MIGVDTNVLLRHLLQDDPVQGPRATAWLEANLSRARPGLVDRIVLVEMVWVLSRGYRYPRPQIAALLEQVLHAGELVVDTADEVRRALALYRAGGIDFADALLGLVNARAGCTTTVTFDREAARMDEFMPLS